MELSELYDRLYRMAGKVLAKRRPCQKCAACVYHGGIKSGCCKGCPLLGPDGCTVQSLACKLWLCYESARDRLAVHQLDRIQRIAYRHGIYFARATKEEALSLEAVGKTTWYFAHSRGRGS